MLDKVLLVGGSGYLGQHLQQVLRNAGYTVHITGTAHREEESFHRISFEDEGSFESLSECKYDLMIVLAARLDALGTTRLNHPDLKTNVVAYANFLDYAAQNKIADRVIYISSMTVYGMENSLPAQENGIINPVNTYGLSKYMGETVSSFYCGRNGVHGVVFRLPGIYGGTRKSGYIHHILRKCLVNEDILLDSKGLLYWETINVHDLVDILFRFIQIYQWGKIFDVFNIGYGEETDFYKTGYLIKSLLKSKSRIVEAGTKGYIPFYMSNKKIKNIVPVDEGFENSLRKYLSSFS